MSVKLDLSHTLPDSRGKPQKAVNRTLVVTNSNAGPVTFKILTTMPSRCSCKPPMARVEPSKSVVVQVTFYAEPPERDAKKNKLLIQSMHIPPGEDDLDMQDLWIRAKQGMERNIYEQRLVVRYPPPSRRSVFSALMPLNIVPDRRGQCSHPSSSQSPSPSPSPPPPPLPQDLTTPFTFGANASSRLPLSSRQLDLLQRLAEQNVQGSMLRALFQQMATENAGSREAVLPPADFDDFDDPPPAYDGDLELC